MLKVTLCFEAGCIDGADVVLPDGPTVFGVVVGADKFGNVTFLGEHDDGTAVAVKVQIRTNLMNWQDGVWFANQPVVDDEALRTTEVIWAVVGEDPTSGTARIMRQRLHTVQCEGD